jgi:hypothetical protein
MIKCKLCSCPADWVFHYKVGDSPNESQRYYCALHKIELADAIKETIDCMSSIMDCTIWSFWSLIN